MKIRILSVGTKAPAWVRQGVDEYTKRMPHELKLEVIEINPGKHHQDETKFKAAEGNKMLSLIGQRDWVVSLDERGRQLTSLQLADTLDQWLGQGRDVVMTVGGASGLHEEVLRRADDSIALSALTLPHYLVRVVLVETLYRAWSINCGHPYHKA